MLEFQVALELLNQCIRLRSFYFPRCHIYVYMCVYVLDIHYDYICITTVLHNVVQKSCIYKKRICEKKDSFFHMCLVCDKYLHLSHSYQYAKHFQRHNKNNPCEIVIRNNFQHMIYRAVTDYNYI